MNSSQETVYSKSGSEIKLRIDVDYAFPSRLKSFFHTVLRFNSGKSYLKNPKIIAKMINESKRNVRAYWFFTPTTIPDVEMLELLDVRKHEVALHVATNPYNELKVLEEATRRRIKYYTVHGTARLVARLMWRRKLSEAKVTIPPGFPLLSFYEFPTMSIDVISYTSPPCKVSEIVEKSLAESRVLHFHPEWLFQRGTINHRGPYYEVLRKILDTDKDLEGLHVRKKSFAKLASYFDINEYLRDFVPTEYFLKKLNERGIDIFTFVERKCCFNLSNPSKNWARAGEIIGMLHLGTYEKWWKSVGKKTRNMVRKAEKNGITARVVEPSEMLAEGIWKIYNETPTRQARSFPHYGQPLKSVTEGVLHSENTTFVGAFLEDELVGFILLVRGNNIAIIAQILSLQKHWNKAINNILVAKTIEVCATKQVQWIMYGRMGNHPSLDTFKKSNNFQEFAFTRYYIPLTRKGQILITMGLHRNLKDALPLWLKKPLFPIFNWVSRNKQRIKLGLFSNR